MSSAAANLAQPVNMALSQLITNEVRDTRLLSAMIAVPRERCVPAHLSGAAFVDEDLPLGNGRCLMEPLTFARLVMAAELKPTDTVLDVGCGYGYSTAVIARLVKEVVGVESDASMAAAAASNMKAFGASNAHVEKVEALAKGSASGKPYDAIIVEGAVTSQPAELVKMLRDGGRLVMVEQIRSRQPGLSGGLGRIVTYVNVAGDIQRREGLEASTPLLPGFEQRSAFTF